MIEVEEQQSPEAQAPDTPAPKQKNKGGRPRKDGAPVGSRASETKASVIPNPPFTKYYSSHGNPNQKTRAAWTWWNGLPTPMKEIVEAHVYRDWPVLLDPPEGEYKYIDVIIGTDPVQN